jgi:iron complex outermembrane receptor protein
MSLTRRHRKLIPMATGAAMAALTTVGHAQSTATQIEQGTLDEVVVTGERLGLKGLIQKEDSTKSRTTVTSEYLGTQIAGQSVVQSLNLVPGVNFTNSDPYGASGGNLRVRGFDGNRISLMVDGIQLNDSGNYAIYTNQQLDPEVLERASVNLGSTDVDSPTASATGGTINLVMARPRRTPSLMLQPSVGSDNFKRLSARGDTGAFGPWGTTAFVEASQQQYDKFKGPGDLKRTQFNARLYQDLNDGDFFSLSAHYNRNRNAFYGTLTKAQLDAGNWTADNDPTCTRSTPGAGVQNENNAPFTCTNYYGVRINPSNTGNLRGQLSLGLTDSLRFTFDPSFQYALANGGGYTAVFENDGRLRGPTTTAGVDLNGDGDFVDRIALYSPSNTNTHRYGVNSGLLWTISPESLIRLSYTLDYARHRQTGEYNKLASNGDPQNVFGGRNGTAVQTADGNVFQKRDRFSIAKLNQVSLSYSGKYMEDRLKLNVGLRAPFFQRDLNQYCYTPTANPGGDPFCTSQVANAPNPTTGYVTFTGSSATYVPPYKGTKKYDKLLPNIGLSVEPWADANQFFVSYAKGFSAPRTDNLYSLQIVDVQPETTNTYELGYRYQGDTLVGSTSLWKTDYSNRIVSSYDPDQGISIDRNVGKVKLWGIDAALGVQPVEGLSLYATGSYNHSEVQSNVQVNATTVAPTAGKQVVETPKMTWGGRAEYKIAGFSVGLQGKYVARRWATDVNDQFAHPYTTFDADARYAFSFFGSESYLQFNVLNLTDKQYVGNISTQISTTTGTPRYSVGAPRTFQASWQVILGGK